MGRILTDATKELILEVDAEEIEVEEPKPPRTWMYHSEYPEGVVFLVGSPTYIECVLTGEWYDHPDSERGATITPANALGGPEMFVLEVEEEPPADPAPAPVTPPAAKPKKKAPKKKPDLVMEV